MTYLELKKMALMQLYNGSDFTYILHDGECLLLKYIGRKKIVFIPDMIADCVVTEIDSRCFCDNSKVTEVYVPDTVKIIW